MQRTAAARAACRSGSPRVRVDFATLFSRQRLGTPLVMRRTDRRRAKCGAAGSNDGPTGNAAALTKRSTSASQAAAFLLAHTGNAPGGSTSEEPEGNHTAMSMKNRSGVSRRALLKSAGTGALMAAVASEFPFGVHIAQAAGPRNHQGQSRLHRAHRRGAAVRRQGEGHLREVRHEGCRSAEAGLVGRDARQSRARRRRQRHRRRAHPHADAVPDLGRQGDAEQRADADVHPGAAQSERTVHLGREGIRGPQGRRRHQAVQGRRSRRRRPPASR